MTDEVLRLAEMAAAAGAHGVVCSGREARAVRDGLATGSRCSSRACARRARTDDHARVVTPRRRAAAGARYVVVGRIVTAAPDRRAAMREVQPPWSETHGG